VATGFSTCVYQPCQYPSSIAVALGLRWSGGAGGTGTVQVLVWSDTVADGAISTTRDWLDRASDKWSCKRLSILLLGDDVDCWLL
jgi:hypothetical protein